MIPITHSESSQIDFGARTNHITVRDSSHFKLYK